MRTEKDKLGAMELDDNVLYGIQTARAAKNFDLKHKKTQMRLINAIVLVKKAAALTYIKMDIGQDDVYPAIVKACDHILAGCADEAFITEALQGGVLQLVVKGLEQLIGLSQLVFCQQGAKQRNPCALTTG